MQGTQHSSQQSIRHTIHNCLQDPIRRANRKPHGTWKGRAHLTEEQEEAVGAGELDVRVLHTDVAGLELAGQIQSRILKAASRHRDARSTVESWQRIGASGVRAHVSEVTAMAVGVVSLHCALMTTSSGEPEVEMPPVHCAVGQLTVPVVAGSNTDVAAHATRSTQKGSRRLRAKVQHERESQEEIGVANAAMRLLSSIRLMAYILLQRWKAKHDSQRRGNAMQECFRKASSESEFRVHVGRQTHGQHGGAQIVYRDGRILAMKSFLCQDRHSEN